MNAKPRYNLLSFLAVDPNPPIRPDEFYSTWDWFTKPLLQAYVSSGAKAFQTATKLPPLFPGELFSTFKLEMRKLLDEMSAIRDSNSSVGEYLQRSEKNMKDTLESVARDIFGELTVTNNDGGENADAAWVQNLCTLVDPYSFPLESVVYGKQQKIADAVEIIEQNTAALEAYRREQIQRNAELYEETNRLASTVYAMQKINKNMDRVLEVVR